MNASDYGPELSLNPVQEDLLRTALSSTTPSRNSPAKFQATSSKRSVSDPKHVQQITGSMPNGASAYTSPMQETPGSGQLGSFDESPFLDYELDDGNFDWDNSGDQLFGDLPGTEYSGEGDQHDKRKASIDDDDEEEGSSKRREGEDKTSKKPGRKPLTGEPTTKRKAQNRAAQRAFRERKERHLKDLETKVEDLEKASESTNHENGRLRAQVEKLNMELKEYRKRLAATTSAAGYSPPPSATQSRNYHNGNGDDFQFAFPKFGDLPGASFMSNGTIAKTSSPPLAGQPQRSASASTATSPGILRKQSSSSTSTKSPTNANGASATPMGQSRSYQAPFNGFNTNSFDELNELFSPSILENASRRSTVDYLSSASSRAASTSSVPKQGNTIGQTQMPAMRHGSSTSITGSPSSMSHGALDSSCGTTPESSADSPDNRKSNEGTLNTISEEGKYQNNIGGLSGFMKSPATEINGIDWMAQQNGGQFDPVLFGDYRDSQDNILNSASLGDFFNDAFPVQDFGTPYFTNDPVSKKEPMKEIKTAQKDSPSQLTPAVDKEKFLTCDKIWERVQASEKSNDEEVDMDELCAQLKLKAKCSGQGAVIAQKDVDAILGPVPEGQNDFLKMFM